MGYELHIFRRDNLEDFEEESNISLQEWLTYIEGDEELELSEGYNVKIPGVENSSISAPGFCVWNNHPTLTGEDKPWLDFFNGTISTKYPDEPTIRKMVEIADDLGGMVQGDDGEFYDKNYLGDDLNVNFEKGKSTFKDSQKLSAARPWWKFW